MPEAVIVSVARTPIGRAQKGSLKNERPDDLTAFIVDTALNKIPELDRNTVEDLILGCGQPAGEAGYNLGRIVAIQAGMPTVPGVTINRYCSSSLMSVRMAAQAIKAGEGDVFIAAGIETVSRFVGHGRLRPPAPSRRRRGRTAEFSVAAGAWTPFRWPARRLHRHGSDGRERGHLQGHHP
jgi:acetyl-CoA C-acetyltransferase